MRRRSDGHPCRAYAIHGATVCIKHGGASGHIRRKAAQRFAEQKAAAALGQLGPLVVSPVDNPLAELAKLAGEVVAWKELCARYVSSLEKLRDTDDKGAEQIRGEIQLFERAMDRCVATLGLIAKLNLDERLVKISEEQVTLVERALTAALSEIGLDEATQCKALGHLGRHLRAVAVG